MNSSPSFRSILRSLTALVAALVCSVAFAQAAAPSILIVGDSISAAYGLRPGAGWTTLLQQRLEAEHYPHRVVNASSSGDTSAGGRARLAALLAQHRPVISIIELGGNDGLRGGSLEALQGNLDAMVTMAQKAGSRVLLVGMRLPPNYGPAYVQRFDATFANVAKARKIALVPFLFDGFGENNALFQPDRVHPTAAAQPKLLDNVWRELRPLVYCWRGGQRSRALTQVLNEIGWRAVQLEGGYRAYRRHVVAELARLPLRFRFVVICGLTGSGKSRLLGALGRSGAQTLDLEGIARHRGSLLGEVPGDPQPSQKWFESQLFDALGRLDGSRPVFVESESRRIGSVQMPDALLAQMRIGRALTLVTPLEQRVALLKEEYAHFLCAPASLGACLEPLVELHGKAR